MNSYLEAEKVREMLRADAPAVVLGTLLIAVGLAACVLISCAKLLSAASEASVASGSALAGA